MRDKGREYKLLWRRRGIPDDDYIVVNSTFLAPFDKNNRISLTPKTLDNLGIDLVFKKIEVEDDGVYICYFGDEEIFQWHTIRMRVLTLVEEKNGKELKLHCNITGIPKPTVWWEIFTEKERNLTIGKENSSDGAKLNYRNVDGTLVIDKLSPEMTGNYTCLASNSVGAMAHRTMVLRVICQFTI
ncbi:Immunoglobulin superfamily member 10 [Cichlidogyrus casuarinus]|uniref:Immunoglobulin superfamily member 10 n=1 Tax=Cichlidogyrus casuarinus TaxID=1844966 RepID=A0ABD2Q7E8_9PLAT